METLGAIASGITLAILFKHALEGWDMIGLYTDHDADFNKIHLLFKLEKCRLYTWGEAIGLADNTDGDSRLQGWHSENLVTECLRQIIHLFMDAESLREKYGCIDTTTGITSSRIGESKPSKSGNIAAAFYNFRTKALTSRRNQPRVTQKSRWVIRDRKKFIALVEEVRVLINSLEAITDDLSNTKRLEDELQTRIARIPDINTLLMIASAWKELHSRIASAASDQAECLSMSSGMGWDISDWESPIDGEGLEGTLVSRLENFTVTDLKHQILKFDDEFVWMKEKSIIAAWEFGFHTVCLDLWTLSLLIFLSTTYLRVSTLIV